MHARIAALEAELRDLRNAPPSLSPILQGRLVRLESLFEAVDGSPSRQVTERFTSLERSLGERIDRAASAVGRVEVLNARLEEMEDVFSERIDILMARGEGLERRLKDATGATGVAEWREEIRALRQETQETWAAESAAQPWRDELAAIKDELEEVRGVLAESVRSAEQWHDAAEELRADVQMVTVRLEAMETAMLDDSGRENEEVPAWAVEMRERFETFADERNATDQVLAALASRIEELESRPAAGASDALTGVKGIGPKYAMALEAQGVRERAQLAELADDDVSRLAKELGVPLKRVRSWRQHARL